MIEIVSSNAVKVKKVVSQELKAIRGSLKKEEITFERRKVVGERFVRSSLRSVER